MTISPEESVYIDRRKNCTTDEVVAKLIGWTQGPIRRRFTDDEVEVLDEDGFYTLDLASPVHSETIYSQEEPLEFTLLGHLGLARDSFVAAVEGNASLAEIHEKKAAIQAALKRIEDAKVYFRDIESELAKGKSSILKIDPKAKNTPSDPALTRESVKLWARKKYKISLIDWEFAAGPKELPPTGMKGSQGSNQRAPARQRLRAQEHAILEVIKDLGLAPNCLPKNKGNESGVKSAVRAKLRGNALFSSQRVFDKAWERMLGFDIAYAAEASSP